MSEDANNLTCAAFQAQLPDLIGSGEDASSHPHLQSCELCSALLADLVTIAEAARQLFPIADPPETLWEHIESAIKNEAQSPQTESPAGDDIANSTPGLSVEPA
jgi:hypothetical protein